MRRHLARAGTPAAERPAPARGPAPAPAPAAPHAASPLPDVPSATDVQQFQARAGNQATVQALRHGAPVVQRALSVEQAETIARRLEDAMSGLGTDEEAIYGALAGRTPTDYVAIREAFAHLFDEELDEELADELTDDELARVKRQLAGTRDAAALPAGEQAAARTERARAIAEQLRDAMADLGTEEDQIWNALEGRSPDEIAEIKREYRALTGRHLDMDFRDDLSGEELRRALDLVGIRDVGTFENYVRQEMTEGYVTAGSGQFDWMLEPEQLRVEVPVKFVPDDGVTVPLADWNGLVDRKWNQFAVVEEGGEGRKVPINISMTSDPGGPHRVNVHRNTDPNDPLADRADAANWYRVMDPSTVPHEFGHLIGLPDEYQRTAEDYKAIVGTTPAGPAAPDDHPADDVARDLHDALYLDEPAQRVADATRLLKEVGLIKSGAPMQGAYAQAVKQAYDAAYAGVFSKNLVEAMRDRLPEGSKWTIQSVFSFASRSIMGNPDVFRAASPHDHAVEARHLRHFVDIVKQAWPDARWAVGSK